MSLQVKRSSTAAGVVLLLHPAVAILQLQRPVVGPELLVSISEPHAVEAKVITAHTNRLHVNDLQAEDAHSADALDESTFDAPVQEYQCASEYTTPSFGCKTCNMTTTCACDGFVRMGYGSQWSNFMNVSGTIECNAGGFGMDPYVGHGKICMCRPKVFTCATEYPQPISICPFCTMSQTCVCSGQVRYGADGSFTPWVYVQSAVECSNSQFSQFGDPAAGKGKLCECAPSNLLADIPAVGGPFLLRLPSNIVLKSILAVAFTYFSVYVLLSLLRSKVPMIFVGANAGFFERALEIATTSSVYVAPMLCVLFFELDKRATALTNGNPWNFGMPPIWLQWLTPMCAGAFWLQTVSHILAEWYALDLRSWGEARRAGVRHIMAPPQSKMRSAQISRIVFDITTALLYVSLILILLGMLLLREPSSLVAEIGRLRLPPGDMCTTILVLSYMFVYLCFGVLQMLDIAKSDRGEPGFAFSIEVVKLAATSMNFAPMLCILFLGTETAVDWGGGTLAPIAARWMYIATTSVLLQTVLVVTAPFLSDSELQLTGPNGEVELVTQTSQLLVFISCCRLCAIAFLYYGVFIIYIALWSSSGEPKLIHTLYRFVGMYFLVYLALWVAITFRSLIGVSNRIVSVLSAAKDAVVFCPMLAAFFLEVFVQARGLTNKFGQPGEPQSYSQDFMFIAECAVALQVLMTLVVGWLGFMFKNGAARTISNLSLVFLYVSVAIVAYSTFTISSANADSEGALLS